MSEVNFTLALQKVRRLLREAQDELVYLEHTVGGKKYEESTLDEMVVSVTVHDVLESVGEDLAMISAALEQS